MSTPAPKKMIETIENSAEKPAKKRTSEKDVLAYLTRRPDFFMKHPTLLDELKLKRSEGNVTSLNTVRASRKEKQSDKLKLQQERLYNTARNNENTAQSIFMCVEALSGMTTLAQFRTFVQTTLKNELELDATRLLLAAEESTATTLSASDIDDLTDNAPVTPRTLHDVADRALYGATGKLMKSDLLLTLADNSGQIKALIALGSKDDTRFHAGQSLELATFLTNVLSNTLVRVQK